MRNLRLLACARPVLTELDVRCCASAWSWSGASSFLADEDVAGSGISAYLGQARHVLTDGTRRTGLRLAGWAPGAHLLRPRG
jgi:hypothetical protein